jgi:hypothetical protein
MMEAMLDVLVVVCVHVTPNQVPSRQGSPEDAQEGRNALTNVAICLITSRSGAAVVVGLLVRAARSEMETRNKEKSAFDIIFEYFIMSTTREDIICIRKCIPIVLLS